MQVESRVGTQALSEGSLNQASLDHQGDLRTVDGHGRYYVPNYYSKLFSAVVAAAGVAGQQGTSLAATCALALCNPTASGVNAILNRVSIGLISGTAGVCTYVLAAYLSQGATAAAGTTITPKPMNNGAAVSQCTAGTGASVTAAAPTIIVRPTGLSTGADAGGANVVPLLIDEVAGAVIVPPGVALVLFGLGAAGTSEKNLYGFEWEEAPI